MNEDISALPRAVIAPSRLNWLLWLIPLACALLCAWYVGMDIVLAGPVVTISFQDAEGLQVENTLLLYRGVQVGEIKKLALAADRQSVRVTVQLKAEAAGLARQDSLFWIVRPELKLGSVSGLRTIVSGNYISVRPGSGERTNVFIGLEHEPIEPGHALDIRLLAPKLGSLQPGSPVFYRDIQVGEVVDSRLGDDAREVVIHARIAEEYAPLVRADSVFWNAGGINFHIGLFSGANISAESAQTLVSGGIAFATPPDFKEVATNDAVFTLNETADDAWQKWSPAIPLKALPAAGANKASFPVLEPK